MIRHTNVIAGDRACNRHRGLLWTTRARRGLDLRQITFDRIDERWMVGALQNLFFVDVIALEQCKARVRAADVGDQFRRRIVR